MANHTRSAKSGSNWTSSDLDAYNIRISTVDTEEFFGIPQLPAPFVDPIILNHVDAPVGPQLTRNVRHFFRLLSDVATACQCDYDTAQEAAIVSDFSFHLMGELLQLDEPDRLFHRRRVLPFITSGKQVRLDIVMHDSEHRIVLISETKRSSSQYQAEPRLVAKALAAFYADNVDRTAEGFPPILSKKYIGIVMIGTVPQFYKITITQALVDAVGQAQFPTEETLVQRFIPPVPNTEGMRPLENRHVYFQCFEALKALL